VGDGQQSEDVATVVGSVTADIVESGDTESTAVADVDVAAEPDVVADATVVETDPVRDLVAAVDRLAGQVSAAREHAAARERVIERLFEDNDRLRAGERLLVLRPVAVDLQRLRNDLLRQAGSLPEQMATAQIAGLLRSFAFDAEQALERCGVAVIRPETGDRFDPSRHRASAAVPAPAPDFDASIAAVVADGYLDTVTERVISTATVQVYRWVPEQAVPTESPLEAPAP
jgi:molecular chaperone GrpE (heat shock protein)